MYRMMDKKILKISFIQLLILLVVSLHSCQDVVKQETSTLSHEYDQINEYLVKYVESDRPEANMFALNRRLKSKLFQVMGGSLKRAVIQFTSMFKAISSKRMCDKRGIEILQSNGNALNSTDRMRDHNYSLLRIDRLIEYYHYEYALLCMDWVRSSWGTVASYGFKQVAYEEINKFLKEQELDKSADKSIEMIETQLAIWEKENKNGALTIAAKQIISLGKVLNENKCSNKAFKILYKNELAARLWSESDTMGYLQDLVNHFAEEHSRLCRDVYPVKFRATIQQLDALTLRSVLILTCEFFFQYVQPADLAEMIEHSKYKQINSDFTTPEIVELMKKVDPDEKKTDLSYNITHNLLIQALRYIITESHPDYGFLTRAFKQQSRHQYGIKIEDLYLKYLYNPCKIYLELIDKEIIAPYNYDSRRQQNTDVYLRDELLKEPGFNLGKSASSLCAIILNNADRHIAELQVVIISLGFQQPEE